MNPMISWQVASGRASELRNVERRLVYRAFWPRHRS
jgi:hypothetical protein